MHLNLSLHLSVTLCPYEMNVARLTAPIENRVNGNLALVSIDAVFNGCG